MKTANRGTKMLDDLRFTDEVYKDKFTTCLPAEAASLSQFEVDTLISSMKERIAAEPVLREWAIQTIESVSASFAGEFQRFREKANSMDLLYGERCKSKSISFADLDHLYFFADPLQLFNVLKEKLNSPGDDASRANKFKSAIPGVTFVRILLDNHNRLSLIFVENDEIFAVVPKIVVEIDRDHLTIECIVEHDITYRSGSTSISFKNVFGPTTMLIKSLMAAGFLIKSERGQCLSTVNYKGLPVQYPLPSLRMQSLTGSIGLVKESYDFSHTGYHVLAKEVPSVFVMAAEILLRPRLPVEAGDQVWEPALALRRAAEQVWRYWRTKRPEPLQRPPAWLDILAALFDVDSGSSERRPTFVLPADSTKPPPPPRSRSIAPDRGR
jgi:hypothetical protein